MIRGEKVTLSYFVCGIITLLHFCDSTLCTTTKDVLKCVWVQSMVQSSSPVYWIAKTRRRAINRLFRSAIYHKRVISSLKEMEHFNKRSITSRQVVRFSEPPNKAHGLAALDDDKPLPGLPPQHLTFDGNGLPTSQQSDISAKRLKMKLKSSC